MQMITATKLSMTECCFINEVERQIKIAKITIKVLKPFETLFSFIQADAIPIE
jgi:hypothetical protein